MLVKMAEALGRISLAGRELTRLAGFTERVTQLITVLDDLNKGVYQRTMITDKDANNNNTSEKASSTVVALKPNSGKFIYQDNIIKLVNKSQIFVSIIYQVVGNILKIRQSSIGHAKR